MTKPDFLSGLTPEEREVLKPLFEKLDEGLKVFEDPAQIREIVPIEDWLESEYYIGPSLKKSLFPFWKKEIIDYVNGGYTEWLISGSLGCGKSFSAMVAMVRKFYELSCYEFPQRLFGLADVSKIFFAYFSTGMRTAQLTGFSDIRDMIDDIPYFSRDFPRNDKLDSLIVFPQRRMTMVSGSTMLHAIGMNLLGAALDETNFMRLGGNSSAGDLSKAMDLYKQITERRRTRFMSHGKDAGFSILISSATHQSSFTETRIKNADETLKVTIANPWMVRPEKFSDKRFFIFTGSGKLDPFIVEDPEEVLSLVSLPEDEERIKEEIDLLEGADKDEIISNIVPILSEDLKKKFCPVPTDFRSDFKRDIYSAMANIAGISTIPVGKLFSSVVMWNNCISPDLSHPFSKESFIVSMNTPYSVADYLTFDRLFVSVRGETRPRRHSHAKRYLHIDQSLTGDCTGIGCVHVAGYVESDKLQSAFPIIELDFALRITPPPKPDQISIAKIRDFIFTLRQWNMMIGSVTYDQYASPESIQTLLSHRINSKVLSVDKNDLPWLQFIELIHEKRFLMYDYPPFKKEFFALDHDRVKRKVDHPANSQKDVCDGVIGAVATCLEEVSIAGNPATSLKDADIFLEEAEDEEAWWCPGYSVSRNGRIKKVNKG